MIRQLEYKTEVIRVSRWFPSTQLCNDCKHQQKLTLEDRTWKCDKCGVVHDRDENAKDNIYEEGRRLIEYNIPWLAAFSFMLDRDKKILEKLSKENAIRRMEWDYTCYTAILLNMNVGYTARNAGINAFGDGTAAACTGRVVSSVVELGTRLQSDEEPVRSEMLNFDQC